MVGLECRENRPFSGQQHKAQIGLNPALVKSTHYVCETFFTSRINIAFYGFDFFGHRIVT